jgi:hypothetical protein
VAAEKVISWAISATRSWRVVRRNALKSKSYQTGFGCENWNVLSAKIECPTPASAKSEERSLSASGATKNAAIDHATVTRREPTAARDRCP